MNQQDNRRDLEHPFFMSYLTGLYVATNAISDAYLLVDGPNCVFFRTAHIQGNHDWLSTLVSSDGLHRVADSDCTTERAAAADNRLLIERLRRLDNLERCRLVLLGTMSPVAVTGPQYQKLLSENGPWKKPVLLLPFGSLQNDWLGGYQAALESLAANLPLREEKRSENKVAIVGHLMDRNEGDARANLAELARLLGGLGLKLCACWLDGGPRHGLQRVARAATIVSLPYGRRAAAILAERTGARLVECPLPLGLEATGRWLRAIAAATGREKRAERFIRSELSYIAPQLEFLLLKRFLHRQAALLGNDPYLLGALSEMLQELGLSVVLLAVFSVRRTAQEISNDENAAAGLCLVNPELETVRSKLQDLFMAGQLDLVVGNSRVLPLLESLPGRVPMVEMGFPSYLTHFFSESPWLGYRGALGLVERMANAIAYESWRRFWPEQQRPPV